MTKTRQTADVATWERFHRVGMSLLPVRNPVDLLHALARAWKELTGVPELFVSLRAPDGKQLWGSLIDAENIYSFIRGDLAGAEWSESEALTALREQAGSNFEFVRSGMVIPFFIPGEKTGALVDQTSTVGAAILFCETFEDAEPLLLEQLAELSGRLIQQGALMTPNGFETVECSHEGGASRHTPESGVVTIDPAKLEALAEFSAGAGHEINNPLATINGRVQLLLQNETDPQRRQSLLTIGGQAYRIRDMIGDAMLFGRPPEPEPEPLDLSEVVTSVVETVFEEYKPQDVILHAELSTPVPVRADRSQLSVVVSNLVQNSLNSLRTQGSKIHVSTETVIEKDVRFALLTVSDDGLGFNGEECEHLFDPFYSARQAGRGLGFGLPKSWQIVSNHGGRIEVTSVPKGKTTFHIFWPAGRDDGGTVAV